MYTLPNLLAATAIMAIIVISLAPFALETSAALAVERASELLARDLAEVQQRAVTENITYIVFFSRSDRHYTIQRINDNVPVILRMEYLPSGVDWKFNNEKLTFHASGRCPQGGSYSLFQIGTNRVLTVKVASHSGRVRIEEGE